MGSSPSNSPPAPKKPTDKNPPSNVPPANAQPAAAAPTAQEPPSAPIPQQLPASAQPPPQLLPNSKLPPPSQPTPAQQPLPALQQTISPQPTPRGDTLGVPNTSLQPPGPYWTTAAPFAAPPTPIGPQGLMFQQVQVPYGSMPLAAQVGAQPPIWPYMPGMQRGQPLPGGLSWTLPLMPSVPGGQSGPQGSWSDPYPNVESRADDEYNSKPRLRARLQLSAANSLGLTEAYVRADCGFRCAAYMAEHLLA